MYMYIQLRVSHICICIRMYCIVLCGMVYVFLVTIAVMLLNLYNFKFGLILTNLYLKLKTQPYNTYYSSINIALLSYTHIYKYTSLTVYTILLLLLQNRKQQSSLLWERDLPLYLVDLIK